MSHSTYLPVLNAAQREWCRRNGVDFVCNDKDRVTCFQKRGRFLDVGKGVESFFIYRMPSVKLDGPDMNDGEPVTVARDLPSLRAALAVLAGGV